MTYADDEDIKGMTQEVKDALPPERYTKALQLAIPHAEIKIRNKLLKNNITPPSTNDTLTNAANLYAAAFIFDTYYSGNETSSPTSKSYKEDADELVEGYIQTIHNNDNQPDSPIITATYIG